VVCGIEAREGAIAQRSEPFLEQASDHLASLLFATFPTTTPSCDPDLHAVEAKLILAPASQRARLGIVAQLAQRLIRLVDVGILMATWRLSSSVFAATPPTVAPA
jgi:hypothetical protein